MQYQHTPRRGTRPRRYPNSIRSYRLRAGVSQARLAHVVGTTRSALSRWERGQSLPRIPELFRLAKSLDTLAESLYLAFYPMHRPGREGHAAR